MKTKIDWHIAGIALAILFGLIALGDLWLGPGVIFKQLTGW